MTYMIFDLTRDERGVVVATALLGTYHEVSPLDESDHESHLEYRVIPVRMVNNLMGGKVFKMDCLVRTHSLNGEHELPEPQPFVGYYRYEEHGGPL